MLSDISVGERSGRVIVREGFGNKVRTMPLNASARLALAVYLAPQRGFCGEKCCDPIYTQRSAHFTVIWYVVSFRQK
jgi:site-specific recombinase XerD